MNARFLQQDYADPAAFSIEAAKPSLRPHGARVFALPAPRDALENKRRLEGRATEKVTGDGWMIVGAKRSLLRCTGESGTLRDEEGLRLLFQCAWV